MKAPFLAHIGLPDLTLLDYKTLEVPPFNNIGCLNPLLNLIYSAARYR